MFLPLFFLFFECRAHPSLFFFILPPLSPAGDLAVFLPFFLVGINVDLMSSPLSFLEPLGSRTSMRKRDASFPLPLSHETLVFFFLCCREECLFFFRPDPSGR